MTDTDCYCEVDPPDFLTHRHPVANKEHTCDECGGRIAWGERYEYVCGKWDAAGVVQHKTCQRCLDLRTWVRNNLPCFCWSMGTLFDDAKAAVDEAVTLAPEETAGLRFGLARRVVRIERFNSPRSAA